jgi:hypothetical protein
MIIILSFLPLLLARIHAALSLHTRIPYTPLPAVFFFSAQSLDRSDLLTNVWLPSLWPLLTLSFSFEDVAFLVSEHLKKEQHAGGGGVGTGGPRDQQGGASDLLYSELGGRR